jgi:hypothetical protein
MFFDSDEEIDEAKEFYEPFIQAQFDSFINQDCQSQESEENGH